MASAARNPRHRLDGLAVEAIPADDRGVLYGDGVFRTLRIDDGRPWAFEQQVATLQRDAARLQLPLQANLARAIRDDIAALAGADSGVLRITLTRGSGRRGYAAPAAPQPRRLATFTSGRAGLGNAVGRSLGVAATPVSVSPVLAGVKHLGRLDQVLAAAEVMPESVFDRLMLDPDGHLVCGTRCNLFLRFGETLRTPAVDRAGVAGVMRARIMGGQFADAHASLVQVEAMSLGVDALTDADEIFVTNSVFGVQAIARVVGRDGQVLFQENAHPVAGALVRAIESELGAPC